MLKVWKEIDFNYECMLISCSRGCPQFGDILNGRYSPDLLQPRQGRHHYFLLIDRESRFFQTPFLPGAHSLPVFHSDSRRQPTVYIASVYSRGSANEYPKHTFYLRKKKAQTFTSVLISFG